MKQLKDDEYEILQRTAMTLSVAINLLISDKSKKLINKALREAVIRVSGMNLSDIEEHFREATIKTHLECCYKTGQIRKSSQNRGNNFN